LRINDAQRQLLEQTSIAFKRSLQITQNRYEAGIAGRSDVVQAETQLKATQAQAIDLGVQRSQFEHAIAVLIGKYPSNFVLKPSSIVPDFQNFRRDPLRITGNGVPILPQQSVVFRPPTHRLASPSPNPFFFHP